jgi:hypothetical protein
MRTTPLGAARISKPDDCDAPARPPRDVASDVSVQPGAPRHAALAGLWSEPLAVPTPGAKRLNVALRPCAPDAPAPSATLPYDAPVSAHL